jgi:hypothetical protein
MVVPGRLKRMISFVATPLAAANVKASRSVPGPPSAIEVTVNVFALANMMEVNKTTKSNNCFRIGQPGTGALISVGKIVKIIVFFYALYDLML